MLAIISYKVFVLIPMCSVGKKGNGAGYRSGTGGLVPSIHNAFYRTIY